MGQCEDILDILSEHGIKVKKGLSGEELVELCDDLDDYFWERCSEEAEELARR